VSSSELYSLEQGLNKPIHRSGVLVELLLSGVGIGVICCWNCCYRYSLLEFLLLEFLLSLEMGAHVYSLGGREVEGGLPIHLL
jgi:hypothetical protein